MNVCSGTGFNYPCNCAVVMCIAVCCSGEFSHDAGGPYRESWTLYTQELQSNKLSLFVRVPNYVTGEINKNCWMPNPHSNSATQLGMYVAPVMHPCAALTVACSGTDFWVSFLA